MWHIIALATVSLWTAGNLYLWSLKQEQLDLFFESIGMGIIGFPLLFLYVTRSNG